MKRKYLGLLLLAVFLLFSSIAVCGVLKAVKLQDLMSKNDFNNCGLNKLSSYELDNLNKWIGENLKVSIEKMPSENRNSFDFGMSSSSSGRTISLSDADGASIYASDGTFLGKITKNKYDTDSIFNKYGDHGSKYSSDSIFNKYGDFGSKYSDKSPFNKYAANPPVIIKNGTKLGYLTVNTTLSPRLDPEILVALAEE